jgi:arrestin-related trafficking adapter 3/6
MRLSRPDVNDPTKRRHFEISIDSPFHILSCRASQAQLSLPAYTLPDSDNDHSPSTTLAECGCPGARHVARDGSPVRNPSSLNLTSPLEPVVTAGLTRPQQAHIGGPIHSALQRPIHLTRVPSFNPPSFDEDQPPPPLETPPPLYETIASPTSGLTDYFSRLSDAYEESSDEERLTRGGRVNIPLTPGGRVNRSFDEPRRPSLA